MATGGERTSSKGDDFRHTCGLCMEPYRGRQPKLLPCFHTFCLPCLVTLAATATTPPATDSENALQEKGAEGEKADVSETTGQTEKKDADVEKSDDGGKVVFLCPTCRNPVTVPEGGVASLQTNFYLEYEETSEPQKPLPCEMCEEEERQDATHACDACRKRMCRSCRRLHDMLTDRNTHSVRPLGPQDQPASAANVEVKSRNCQVHPDQVLCFHCQKCDVSICLHCKLTSHEGHVTEDLAATARRAKEELTSLLVTATQQIQVVEASLDRLDRDKRELNRQEKEMTQEVSMRYDTLITKATRARDELLEGLTKRKRAAEKNIDAEKNASGSTVEKLSGLVARASRPSNQDADVVVLKNELRTALLSDDVLEEHSKRAAREQQLVFFPCQTDTSAVELDDVRAYMGELYDADHSLSTSSPGISVRELDNKLNKLDADISSKFATLQSLIQERSRSVSFFARLRQEESGTNAYETVPFKNVQSNEGDSYDTGTGIFTAPVRGLYLFLLTSRARDTNSNSNARIAVNGIEKAHVYCTGTSSGSCQVMTELGVGEKVWVSAGGGCYAANYSTFCGVLLQ
ncbi:hypothetical protein BaRGS_00008698 [Batillaria attramentaria]|uniref:Uncharacterized protein n=1 Tax=Batillaria attramentaria TaxID=370345 RepID=A0ABD0LLM8_9CAEN